MADLLTTKQLLELLQLDRTTVYRMLSEGRLPGFKIGGQWRFSRQEIEAWMKERGTESPSPARPSAEVLPLDCIQPIQDIFAEALNVGAVTTRLDGEPITQVSHCSPFCQLVLGAPQGRQRCIASWRSLARQAERRPHLYTCHAGLMYARGRIEVADEFVAMSFMGQFVTVRLDSQPGTPSGWDREAVIADLVSDCGLEAEALRTAAQEVYVISPDDHPRLNRLLQKLTDAMSEIGCQRLTLLNKLRGIARLTGL
jgi:excisionase family DNA binding protein